jgi:pimeloyl-ACP methyl ester carboxylesterase
MKQNKPVLLSVILLILSCLFPINVSVAQKLKPGPQDLCFFSAVDETDQPYAVYVPNNYDESKKYPLVIFLHGAMSNHRLGLRRVFGQGNNQGGDFIKPGHVPTETDLEATRYFPHLKEVDYIVAAPYARGTAGYQGIPEQDVYDILNDLKRRFTIDEDRIYLTGLSMGGGGTVWLGLTRPDIWAAIAPCCPAPPDGSADLACNAGNLPVHLFVGDKDFLYPVALDWKKKFEANSAHFDYAEYPGIGHNSWEYAYKDGYIFDWFAQYKRNLFPEQVTFSTRWYKYNKAYWIHIDRLTPGSLATIKARFTGENAIEVTTTGLDAFTLNLTGHPKFKAGEKTEINIDGKLFRGMSLNSFYFSKTGDQWTNQRYTPDVNAKQPGAEGPINAVVGSNHIYVYGTGGNPSKEELQARRDVAASAADWSVDRGALGRIMIFPRVISDKEIRPSDLETSNLVLFGSRETNSIIEKYADQLPLHLQTDEKDFGLVYVFPMNHHYILVNSGLPWWTPAGPKEEAQSRSFSFMSTKADILKNLKDFILFRTYSDNSISEGYFDNDWKIPSGEAAKMKSSGVVFIKE